MQAYIHKSHDIKYACTHASMQLARAHLYKDERCALEDIVHAYSLTIVYQKCYMRTPSARAQGTEYAAAPSGDA